MKGRKFRNVLLLVLGLSLPSAQAEAPFFNQGRQYEAAEKWEEAYKAYVQSVENREPVQADEEERAMDRAFLIATEHLGWFDEAIALTDKYLGENKDGCVHSLRGTFYKEKLHDFDKAREEFRLAYEDFKALDGRLFTALYNLSLEAGCYQTQLYEMEYYANRRNRQAYTRKAHDILLEGFSQIGNVEKEWERKSIRNIYMDPLAYIYGQTWYSGYDPDLAREYTQTVREHPDVEQSPFLRAYYEEYEPLAGEKKWAEAARLWERYAEKWPSSTNDLYFLQLQTYDYHQAKEWENTLQTADRTMDLIENQFNEMTTDIEKSLAMESGWLSTYECALVAALRLKRHGEVLDIMERSRARAMLDLLGGRDYSKRQERVSADEREIILLKSRIDEIKDALENERKIGRPGEMASLQRSLTLMEDTSSKIQRRADIARREIRSSTRVEPLTAKEVQELIGEDTLISIFDGIYLGVVTKDHVISREMRGSSYFDKLIRDFRAAIEKRGSQARSMVLESDGKTPSNAAAEEADAQILAIGQEMYRIIFKPAEKYFSQTSDRIYVVYDRTQPLIPYELLHDGERYLAEKYTLVYAPSASVLKKCMERRHPMGNKLLALGNPDLGNPDYALAYAEDEVKKLAEIYPDSRILTGREASEAAVQLLSSDADILHFACHGVIDEDDPRKNHLRLAPDKENDGYLTADEIMDLHLQCSLVTLSACDTGRGRILMGGEILGLTRAWMYAGAPSVLASLWKVDDRATSRLMTAFYENLKTHDKAKSLQLAQLDMIREGLSPFYWAAFCLYGDYE